MEASCVRGGTVRFFTHGVGRIRGVAFRLMANATAVSSQGACGRAYVRSS